MRGGGGGGGGGGGDGYREYLRRSSRARSIGRRRLAESANLRTLGGPPLQFSAFQTAWRRGRRLAAWRRRRWSAPRLGKLQKQAQRVLGQLDTLSQEPLELVSYWSGHTDDWMAP